VQVEVVLIHEDMYGSFFCHGRLIIWYFSTFIVLRIV
jgi:hypothetical protein